MEHSNFSSEAHRNQTRTTAAVQEVMDDRDQISQTTGHQQLNHHNRMTPIHRLSDDVRLLVLERAANVYRMPPQPKLPPWIESAVCQRWRNVLLACPGLWSGITLIPGEDDEYGQDLERLPLHRLQAQLQLVRSRSCRTLDVYVDVSTMEIFRDHPDEYGAVTPAHEEIAEQTLRTLLAESHRFHSLHLQGSTPRYWNVLPEQPPTFGFLRSLSVTQSCWTERQFLRNTPVLERSRTHAATLT
ncbi:hypothetical protein BDV98DRAFT_597030 [Pterulicium gracile]|uniref:F-box domain-containing protein n=1 Tax=Pterulicium gracile TaxID=1884261 RepID=A0A5C3Q6D0_9AGAR|nr:hypothetical protein BDV98DRAFT_597030 [Pterula gracilis]